MLTNLISLFFSFFVVFLILYIFVYLFKNELGKQVFYFTLALFITIFIFVVLGIFVKESMETTAKNISADTGKSLLLECETKSNRFLVKTNPVTCWECPLNEKLYTDEDPYYCI